MFFLVFPQPEVNALSFHVVIATSTFINEYNINEHKQTNK